MGKKIDPWQAECDAGTLSSAEEILASPQRKKAARGFLKKKEKAIKKVIKKIAPRRKGKK